jgi:hypothetical protein
MASKYHDDWQSSKKTVLQRNAYMFDNALMSDISFACGESSRQFRAHKYVLATSSAVFYAMFYGDLAQRESTIRIKDADEETFEEFLRFLYTDDCEITAENAMKVMYLAKKYLIWPLAEKCCNVLKKAIKTENVFLVLEQAVQFDESDLQAKCWDVVSKNTLECVNSEAFCNIGSRTLSTLLKEGSIDITEVLLFTAVLKWVDSECARQGLNVEEDKTARRRILGDSLYEIRFLAMSQEDFAKYVPPMEILTDAEIVAIFRAFNNVDVAGLKWENREKRCAVRTIGFSRFEIANVIGSWVYGGNESDALTITVNKAVLFHGVRLFGDDHSAEYDVKLTIKEKSDTIAGSYTSERDKEGVWGYDVMLPQPVPLQPDEDFTIIVTIQGAESHRGVNGKSQVTVNDIVVTFKNAPTGLSSNCTDVEDGQFYKIFLSPV